MKKAGLIGLIALAVLTGCSKKCPGPQPKIETISGVPQNARESTGDSLGYISTIIEKDGEYILARSKTNGDDLYLSELSALIDFKAKKKEEIQLTGYYQDEIQLPGYHQDKKFLFETVTIQWGKESFTYEFKKN